MIGYVSLMHSVARSALFCFFIADASGLAAASQANIVPDKNAAITIPAVSMRPAERSYLTKEWNLDGLSGRDAHRLSWLQPYRQTYFIVKSSNSPNTQPSSPGVGNNASAPADIDALETKFQFSVKVDLSNQYRLDFLGLTTLRVWGAYTQQADWQAFNRRNSYPFRETLFEPELIATFGTGQAAGLKLINLGLVHQSNGRSNPDSRSWHRLYLLGGWEWNETTSVTVRGWKRIKMSDSVDDNPDISDYLGSGDVLLRWEPLDQKQSIAMLLRNNLSWTDNRGYVQIDWTTPVELGHTMHLHIQMTSGYGESLIDYNHRQNTFGLGVSFSE